MPNYQDSKIYKIVNTINGTIYYGSTTQKLSRRMASHRTNSKTGTNNFHIAIRTLGSANFSIILVKVFACNSNDELEAEEFKETQLAIARGETLYNMKRAFVSEATVKVEAKQWWDNHPRKALQLKRDWRVTNSGKHLCEACDYSTSAKSDLTKHLGTRKHKLEWDEYVFDVEMDRLADIEL